MHTSSRPCHSGCGSAEQRASQTMLPAPKMSINREGRMPGAWGSGESMAGTGGLAWRTRVKTHLWRSAWTSCDGPLNVCRCALWPLIGVLRPQIRAARSSRPPNDAVTAGPWQSLSLTKGFKRVPCASAPRSPGLDAGATDRPRRIVEVWAMQTCTARWQPDNARHGLLRCSYAPMCRWCAVCEPAGAKPRSMRACMAA